MSKVGIIGAALSSVLLAGPAMAASDGGYGMHQRYREHYGRMMQRMPAQDPGMANPAYSPGWPGPYDDGNYRGHHEDYMRLPPSAHGG